MANAESNRPRIPFWQQEFTHGEALVCTGMRPKDLFNWVQRKIINPKSPPRSHRQFFDFFELCTLHTAAELVKLDLDISPSSVLEAGDQVAERAAELILAHDGEITEKVAERGTVWLILQPGSEWERVSKSELVELVTRTTRPLVVLPCDELFEYVETQAMGFAEMHSYQAPIGNSSKD